jgi:hypothetical protein
MSLDVYLTVVAEETSAPTTERIFVRRDGATVEVTHAEWEEANPGRAPVTVLAPVEACEVFSANITHNLGGMASECGLYAPLWCPEENGYGRAEALIEPLSKGLDRLLSDRTRFEAFNPENGWGDYDLLVSFTENYLAACRQWPNAEVRVWK